MVGCIVITIKQPQYPLIPLVRLYIHVFAIRSLVKIAPRIIKIRNFILKNALPSAAASQDSKEFVENATQQLNEANRERAVCEAESARFIEQGNPAAAAEAAQDAQEWVEHAVQFAAQLS